MLRLLLFNQKCFSLVLTFKVNTTVIFHFCQRKFKQLGNKDPNSCKYLVIYPIHSMRCISVIFVQSSHVMECSPIKGREEEVKT